ncbi:MAG: hypothetical protein A2166_02120 [Omnitrophica WOR_2 bacterium RBG_13_41_10]|nr:MAG: hypothetical protein A2166_02120 [Omnitrophica WOR_2 bacterium RBG_13_41_10]
MRRYLIMIVALPLYLLPAEAYLFCVRILKPTTLLQKLELLALYFIFFYKIQRALLYAYADRYFRNRK